MAARFVAVSLLLMVGVWSAGALRSATEQAPVLPAHPDEEAGWQAQWIGPSDRPAAAAPGPDPMANTWVCFRKSFAMERKPASAVARIAVDSRYWLWVNGKIVVFEGGLKRGPTPQDTYCDRVDLAPHLKAGRNTVALLLWYWGKHGFAHKSSGKPGLLFELRAGQAVVAGDRTWKAQIHPAYGHTEAPHPNYRLSESNVRFDARADIGDWTQPAYSDAGWAACEELGRPPAAPWNRLYRRPIPLWKEFGLREYANASTLPAVSTGKEVAARLPYNAQVTPWLRVNAPAGLTIRVQMDNYRGGGEPNVRAEYVTREGVQEWECLGWMNGHEVRYLIPEGVKILGLKYRESGFNTEFSGAFSCDDAFYDRLWEKCRRTLYITMRDNYMDCPDRERAQWWGDAVNELGEAFYALSPSSALLTKKAILNLAFWQRANNTLYSPVPAGNWDKELPPQMLASVGKYGFWTYFLYTGDRETIRVVYPRVKAYLSVWQTDGDGLVVHRRGEWDWGDWGKEIDARLLDNAWYCLALEGAEKMAGLLGHPEDAAQFAARRKSVAEAVNRRFWTGTEYRDPAYKGKTDDRGNALAVVAGLVEPTRYAAVKAVLAREEHASPYMEKYVLEALMLMDDPLAALARMRKRYEAMVSSSLTTLPEMWKGGTDNHAWSGGPLTILSQYVAGVSPTRPGFASYQVLPQMGPLKKVSVTVDSAKGRIGVGLQRDEGRFALKLVSPAGTTAVVGIPVSGPALPRVTVNGQALLERGVPKAVRGVAPKGRSGRYILFEVVPGAWEFVAGA